MAERLVGVPVIVVTLVVMMMAMLSAARADVTPPMVDVTLAPGESIVVDKTVTTPEIPPNPDIVFLTDSTGSMVAKIAQVQADATNIMNTVVGVQPAAQFAAAEYRDVGDFFLCKVNQDMTASIAAVQAGINSWTAGGGGDFPEGQLPCLEQLSTGGIAFRAGSTRIIAWFGDAPGHDPRAGSTLLSATAALQAAGVQVIAIDVNALDSTGQATHITSNTGGSLQPGANVPAAILAGLGNLPITVTPHAVGCDPLNVSWAPASQTVTSGNDVSFTETIAVPNDGSLEGTSVHCTVEFRDSNGNVIGIQEIWVEIPDVTPPELTMPPDATNEATGPDGSVHEFEATATDNVDPNPVVECVPPSGTTFPLGDTTITCTATDASGNSSTGTFVKTVVDTTPPEARCDPTTNPSEKKIPAAPGEGEQGQNQDGYYVLNGSDVVGVASIVVRDDGSAFVSDPFADGDKVKVTQAPGVTPSDNRPGPGAITSHLKLKGDAVLVVTDTSGNIAEVSCLVPPRPQ